MAFSNTNTEKPSAGRRALTYLLWLVLLCAPLIYGAVIGLLTGTSPLRIDAWNTLWNDEVGYFRTIRLLRTDFFPKGMYGFNEDAPSHLAYGPYNIFTYLPYYALSFLTGIDSHNFFYYCNVILALIAMFFFVALVRPKISQSLWALAFLVTHLISARYTWSGMSESSYNLFLILFTSLVLWAVLHTGTTAGKTKAALTAMLLVLFFWNTMRPYYFVLAAIPLYLTLRKKSPLSKKAKIGFSIASVLSALGSIALFYVFMNYNVARYFVESTPSETLGALLGSGSISAFFYFILKTNIAALHDIWGYLRGARWAGVIPLLYFVQSLLLIILLLRTLIAGVPTGDKKKAKPSPGANTAAPAADPAAANSAAAADLEVMAAAAEDNAAGIPEVVTAAVESAAEESAAAESAEPVIEAPVSGENENASGRCKPRDGRCFVILAMLAAGAAVYEATILLYSTEQLHRMMLSVTVVYGLTLIILGGFEKIVDEVVLLALMGFLLLRAPINFALPQVDAQTLSAADEQALRDEFSSILPLAENPWDNTIAKLVDESELQWEFMLPTYTSLNVCRVVKMTELLQTQTLQSKYLMLHDDSDLNALCAQRGYKILWKGYNRTLYLVR